jgi:hypothetical protein
VGCSFVVLMGRCRIGGIGRGDNPHRSRSDKRAEDACDLFFGRYRLVGRKRISSLRNQPRDELGKDHIPATSYCRMGRFAPPPFESVESQV